jgi:hypothetical protein
MEALYFFAGVLATVIIVALVFFIHEIFKKPFP